MQGSWALLAFYGLSLNSMQQTALRRSRSLPILTLVEQKSSKRLSQEDTCNKKSPVVGRSPNSLHDIIYKIAELNFVETVSQTSRIITIKNALGLELSKLKLTNNAKITAALVNSAKTICALNIYYKNLGVFWYIYEITSGKKLFAINSCSIEFLPCNFIKDEREIIYDEYTGNKLKEPAYMALR